MLTLNGRLEEELYQWQRLRAGAMRIGDGLFFFFLFSLEGPELKKTKNISLPHFSILPILRGDFLEESDARLNRRNNEKCNLRNKYIIISYCFFNGAFFKSW